MACLNNTTGLIKLFAQNTRCPAVYDMLFTAAYRISCWRASRTGNKTSNCYVFCDTKFINVSAVRKQIKEYKPTGSFLDYPVNCLHLLYVNLKLSHSTP
jgi:hypothetical protein